MTTRENSRWLTESYWRDKSTDDMEDRVSVLRRSRKGRVVVRRTRKKLGLPLPSKDDHDLDQEQDAIEIDDIQAQLRDRPDRAKSSPQRGNSGGKANCRRVWKRVKKPLKP